MATPPLLPRIHPFWLTLGYGMFVGYNIRKYDIDKKIIESIHRRQDAITRRQASILLDEAEKRKLAVPANSSAYTAEVNNGSTKG
jgi:hypothetical protein